MGKNRAIRRLKNSRKLLSIVRQPDERLRNENGVVSDFSVPGLKEFVMDMIHTVRQLGAVGLAAPQVGWNIRLAVAIINKQPFVMFNPVIVDHDDVDISIEEGCLSCPNEAVKVSRWNDIIIEYNNVKGEKKEVRVAGIDAIIVQHEIDHLNGKMIIDYKSMDNE